MPIAFSSRARADFTTLFPMRWLRLGTGPCSRRAVVAVFSTTMNFIVRLALANASLRTTSLHRSPVRDDKFRRHFSGSRVRGPYQGYCRRPGAPLSLCTDQLQSRPPQPKAGSTRTVREGACLCRFKPSRCAICRVLRKACGDSLNLETAQV